MVRGWGLFQITPCRVTSVAPQLSQLAAELATNHEIFPVVELMAGGMGIFQRRGVYYISLCTIREAYT